MKALFFILLITQVYLNSCEAQSIYVKCNENDDNCSAVSSESPEEHSLNKRSLIPFSFFSEKRSNFNKDRFKLDKGMRFLANASLKNSKCTTKSCLINNLLKLTNSKKLFSIHFILIV